MKSLVRILSVTLFFLFARSIMGAQTGTPTYQFGNNCALLNHYVLNLPCGQTCTDIKFQTPHIKQSSAYEVGSVCYLPFPYNPAGANEIGGVYIDDVYGPIITMPFGFCFFDSVFTKCVAGSNGLLTFDLANANCGNSWQQSQTIPYAGGSICSGGAAYYPKSSIMGVFTDLWPIASVCPPDRKIQWDIEGTAPYRKFVLNYYHVGMYGLGNWSAGGTNCNSTSPSTFQIVLYESTGLIDVYIEQKACTATSGSNGGNAILGIQDWDRTNRSLAAPGKNATLWPTITNEGWRFTPSGGTSRFISAELLTIAGAHVANGDTSTTIAGTLDVKFLNVCPPGNTQQYIVKTIFSSCVDPTEQLITKDTITVNKTTELFATASATSTTCGPPNGTITVTVPAAAGTTPFSYTLDNPPGQSSGNHTFTFNNVAAGPHTVYVSDANGCGSVIPITVASTGTLTVNATPTPTACSGVNNGMITVTPPSGTPPYQYSLNGGPPQASNVFNNLNSGSYTVTVTDGGGCSGTITVVVAAGSAITGNAISTPTSCPTAPDGLITVNPTSGLAPYTYSIDGLPYQSSNVFNTTSGTHYIVIKDANGCLSNTIAVTVASGAALTGSVTSSATTCPGVNNGTITVTPTSGSAPYQYYLDALPPQSSNIFTNVSAGPHTVVFRDATGCSSNNIPVTVGQGSGITGNAASTPTACPGVNNGTITVNATSGTSPYQYSLDGAAYQSTNIFSNVSSGSHNVVILDAAGCSSSPININVGAGTGPTGTAASTPTACPGVNNGTITATPTTGTSPYQFSLDGAAYQTPNVFTNVSSGNHNVVIKDANGCTSAPINVTVAAGAGPTGTATSTATSCAAVSNGTITATPTTGASPYQFSLDGGTYQTSNTFTNVSSGSHNIVIKDANGCTSAPINVTVAAGAGPTGTAVSVATSCPSLGNGSITVTATTGTAPYQYSLNGAAYQLSNTFTNLAAGSYNVVIKDATGCISSQINVTVNQGAGITVNATATATSCPGVNNGIITVTATNGSGAYQYALDGGANQPSNIFNNVASGSHNVTVSDGIGCISAPFPVTVNAGAAVTGSAASTATSCNGANNGTITVTPANGSGPYQYSLDGGANQPSNIFTNVAAGNHTVIFHDAAGCASSPIPVTVAQGSGLTAAINQTNITCNGLTNGSFTVNVNTPGTAPYQYSLDNLTFQPGNVFNNLAAGSYTVYFKDALNCSGSQSVIITQPAALGLNVATQPVVCNGQSNGTITITASGGSSPYQYSLNGTTYQASGTFTVAAGTYTVYLKDVNGCIKTQPNVVITEPAALTASAVTQNASCNGGSDGTITVTAGGGNSGYQYSIDGTNFQSPNVFNVVAGSYTVTIKDSKNCITTTPAVVGLTNNLNFSVGGNPTICEGDSTVLVVNSNATQYSWTPTTGLSNPAIANPLAFPATTTNYTVQASLGGCSTSGAITVNVNAAPVADAGSNPDICFGQDAQLSGSGGVSYQWTPVTYLTDPTISNPQVIQPKGTIQYSLKVIDANGCRSLNTDIVIVNVTPPIQIFVNPKDSIVAEGDQIQLTAVSIGTNYVWTNAATLSNPNIANPVATMPAGSLGNIYNYTVTASTSAGCSGQATVVLKVFKGPDIYVPTAFTPNGDSKNDMFIPFPVGIKELKYFRVYNRWGQLLFSTSKMNDGWDGNFGGHSQPSGVYVWVAEGITKDGKKISKRGTVTLIR